MKQKSLNRGLSVCPVLILIILAFGCVGPTVRTYRGDQLPKSEVAVIKGWYAYLFIFGYQTVDILEVDPTEVSRPLKATKVEVLPGWHELVIRSYGWTWVGYGQKLLFYQKVAFDAEAGHEYKIKYRMARLGKWYLDIKDVTTGTIVCSHPWP